MFLLFVLVNYLWCLLLICLIFSSIRFVYFRSFLNLDNFVLLNVFVDVFKYVCIFLFLVFLNNVVKNLICKVVLLFDIVKLFFL